MNHVPGTRFELVTRGFSVLCSTSWAIPTIHDASSSFYFNIGLGSMSISQLEKRKSITKYYTGSNRISWIFKKKFQSFSTVQVMICIVNYSNLMDSLLKSFVLYAYHVSYISHTSLVIRKKFSLRSICERKE